MTTIIGTRIKTLRGRQALTSKKLAELVGCSARTIQRYENGQSQPDRVNLLRLAEVLETTVEGLIGPTEPDDELTFTPAEIHRFHRQFLELTRGTPKEGRDYYWVSLSITEDGMGHTTITDQFAGYTDETPPRELRGARPMQGDYLAFQMGLCTDLHGQYAVISKLSEFSLYCIFGGQAFILDELCAEVLPDLIGPYLCTHRV